MAAKGGGAWKVAYADFVTAMMAFFLVMWITAQSKPVKQAVAEYFEDPLGTNDGSRSTSFRGPEDATTVGQSQSGMGPGRSLAMANLKSSAPPNPRGVSAVKPPRIIITRDGEHTRATGTQVGFSFGSSVLDEAARERLTLLVPLLLGKPNLIEIRSAVDDRMLASEDAVHECWHQSFRRCNAVKQFLESQGIPADRMRLSQTGAFEPSRLGNQASAAEYLDSVEVFALSEYAMQFDELHDARVQDAKSR